MVSIKSIFGKLHHNFIFKRRLNALCDSIYEHIDPGTVLDVGSGNGMIGSKLMEIREDIKVHGIDVQIRQNSAIETKKYDGKIIPYGDNSFSTVILIDVLHHIDDYQQVVSECLRVSKGKVIIKDHFSENKIDENLLKILDWGGNKPHDVVLPYNFFSRSSWGDMLINNNAIESFRQESVPKMYPWPFQRILGSGIQFISVIESSSNSMNREKKKV